MIIGQNEHLLIEKRLFMVNTPICRSFHMFRDSKLDNMEIGMAKDIRKGDIKGNMCLICIHCPYYFLTNYRVYACSYKKKTDATQSFFIGSFEQRLSQCF